MKIGFLFLTRGEVSNSAIWESYFREANEGEYKIEVYSSVGYNIKNLFFKQFQISHNIHKNREMNVEVKVDFLSRNISECDYFIFLTEDCIPVRSFRKLYDYLSIQCNSIFYYELDPHVNIEDGRRKYGSYRHFNFNEYSRMKNDDWLCLCKRHTSIILSSIEDSYGFHYPFGGEHFISSILNEKGNITEVIKSRFVYENWDGYKNCYPSVFSSQDYDKLANIKKENKNSFFIRKFKDDDSNFELFNQILKYNVG